MTPNSRNRKITKSTSHEEIVEAVLSGSLCAEIENFSSEGSGSIGTWNQVISAAKADAPKADDAVISSVMAQIRNLDEAPAARSGLFSFLQIPRTAIAVVALASLLVAVSILGTPTSDSKSESNSRDTNSQSAQDSTQTPESLVAPKLAEVQNTGSEIVLASFASSVVETDSGSIIRLSNQNSSEPIRHSKAVRLGVLNGSLRIDPL